MTQPISCKDAVRRLWDYLDGAADPDERERIEAHLTFCMRCCGELEFARELRGMLRDRASMASISDGTLERLNSFVDQLPTYELPTDEA